LTVKSKVPLGGAEHPRIKGSRFNKIIFFFISSCYINNQPWSMPFTEIFSIEALCAIFMAN
jgi:hypothetical protein